MSQPLEAQNFKRPKTSTHFNYVEGIALGAGVFLHSHPAFLIAFSRSFGKTPFAKPLHRKTEHQKQLPSPSERVKKQWAHRTSTTRSRYGENNRRTRAMPAESPQGKILPPLGGEPYGAISAKHPEPNHRRDPGCSHYPPLAAVNESAA